MKRNKLIYAIIYILIIVLGICSNFNDYVIYAEAESIDPFEQVKQGIIMIYSGFTDDTGKFYRLKAVNGFLVSQFDSGVYVVTTSEALHSEEKTIIEYCDRNEIAIDGNYNESIQVVVKGDVTVNADILIESKQENYAVLRIDSLIEEKQCLILKKSSELAPGDSVYAFGYADVTDGTSQRYMSFDDADVEVQKGIVQDLTKEKDGVLYLAHTASVTDNNIGGPLVDDEGCVIGLNNYTYIAENGAENYSLPIEEIQEVLDSFAIEYLDNHYVSLINSLQMTLNECRAIQSSNIYTKKSTELLEEAITKCENYMKESDNDEKIMQRYLDELKYAQKNLVPRMKNTRKVIIILAVIIAVLMIRLLYLILSLNRKEKNWKKGSYNKKEKQSDVELVSKDNEKHETSLVYIKRVKNGQIILLGRADIYIGANKDDSDVLIEGNQKISRRHAKINYKNGSYFIADCGSANGTFINGKKIQTDQEAKLNFGDKIDLADEQFEFNGR